MRLLRAVEKHHDQLPLDELAALLGVSRARAIEALRALDDLRGTGAFTGLTPVYDDRDATDDEIARGDDNEAVMIIRTALQTWAPEHAPHLTDHLWNAKIKLGNWQRMLPEPGSTRAAQAV